MAKIFIVDSSGARVADLTTARSRFDEANKAAFGADLDVHAHTPQNEIAGINALVWTEIGEELVRAALYGSSLDHARGKFLDSLGSLLDIRRTQQTYTRVNAILRGTPGTIVPAGRFAKTTNGDQFALETAVTIAQGGSPGVFVAVTPGPIPAEAGTLIDIVSVQSGWDSITNLEDGVLGRLRESDALFRTNLKARTAQSSIGPVPALRSALTFAGSERFRILENAESTSVTTGGAPLSPHSILVISDGGLVDDVERAIENHRSMGVATRSAVVSDNFTLANAQQIQAGRVLFNGNQIKDIDLAGLTLEDMATHLSGLTNAPTFTAGDSNLLAFYNWTSESTGFASYEGKISDSDGVTPLLRPVEGEYSGRQVRVIFNRRIQPETATNNFTIKYTNSGGTEVTVSNSGATVVSGGTFVSINLASANAIPDTATNVNITFSSTIVSRYEDFNDFTADTTPFVLTKVNIDGAPVNPIVYGEPRDGGVAIWASALGDVVQWQYRRFEDDDYIGNDNWIAIPSSNNLTLPAQSGVANGYLITGYNNSISNSVLELRAVRSGLGSTTANSIVFSPNNDVPRPVSFSVDGYFVTIEYDIDLQPSARSGNQTHWTFTRTGIGNAPVANYQRVRNRKCILRLNDNISSTETLRITSTASPNGVVGYNGVQAAAITTATTVTNNTELGIPSTIGNLVAYGVTGGYVIQFEPNFSGGYLIDKHQYQTTFDNGLTYGPWIDLPTNSTRVTITTNRIPDNVRFRSSSINSRAAEILGLLNKDTVPFMRSVPRNIEVSVNLADDQNLTSNQFEQIRTSLVSHVEGYEIGQSLWVNDLEAVVEGLPGVRVSSITVTSDGTDISGVTNNIYNRWVLTRENVDIIFT